MPTTVIGVDPHKRSHTAVVLDAAEQIDSQVQVSTGARRPPPGRSAAVDRLVSWAAPAANGTTLTDIFGIGDIGAATIIAAVGDFHRLPTRGHFAAFNGTAPHRCLIR